MGNLEQAKKQLLGPGRTKIRTVGLFRATLRWNGRVCQEEVYVIDKLHDALLGRPAIKSLDILPSLLEVTASTGKLSDPANILCHYPDLTAGLGLLKTEYRITLLPDAKPSAITYPRRVPLPMLPCVKRELERMENLGVIRKVDEATEWCAPIVAKKKGGELRICVDFGGLNKYILRERVVMPTVDECLARLAGATWLSWSRTEDTVLGNNYLMGTQLERARRLARLHVSYSRNTVILGYSAGRPPVHTVARSAPVLASSPVCCHLVVHTTPPLL
ncbi:hypothetical protein MTO96_034811 [Rhipicephalus appendiculatus]